MFYIFSLFTAVVSTDETIAVLTNNCAKLEINKTGFFQIKDLETGFIYGKGYNFIERQPKFNATLVKSTKEYVEIKGYSNENYIQYRITSKGTHFQFEIIEASKITADTVYFPLISTEYPDAVSSYLSGVVMNDEYSFNLRPRRIDLSYGNGRHSSYIIYSPVNGDFGGDTTSFITVGKTSVFRKYLQKMVVAEKFPTSPHGGPFALDSPRATASYVFGVITEENVDQWIDMCVKYGIEMIHFHLAYETLGHFEPNKERFPNGLEGVKACVDKVHAAGLLAGLHTLCGCIRPNDKYINNGKPDSRLAVDFRYKLKQDVSADDTVIYTTEPPESDFDTTFTYSGKGNVIRIGDELISYKKLLLTEPYGFADCTRGQYNSKATTHTANDDVNHLHVRYLSFQPEYGSSLVTEVSQNIAKMYDLGFDHICHDGSEGMPNKALGESQIRRAMFEAVKSPGSVEGSITDRASWTFHSNIGAYDVPKWGIKRYVDRHVSENIDQRASLLPAQMGWWALNVGSTRMYSQLYDEFEYMCYKTISNDMVFSFQLLDPTQIYNPKENDMMTTFKQWETLRRRKILTNEEKEIVKKPRDEFHIEGNVESGEWEIKRAQYPSQIIKNEVNSTGKVIFNNPYQSQQLGFRIHNLYSIESYDSENGKEIAHFTSPSEFSINTHENATATTEIDHTTVKESTTSMKLHVTHNGSEDDGAWIKLTKDFSPFFNAKETGFGFWIYGDGKGEVLNFQLESHPAYGKSLEEHYVIVDFNGWKYIEMPLLERDADKFDDYKWPYSSTSKLYIFEADHAFIQHLNIYMTNIPVNSECTVYISPVRMLPLVKTTLKSLTLKIGEQSISFDNISLQSGDYLEYTNASYCHFYLCSGDNKTGNIEFNSNVDDLTLNSGSNQFTIEYNMDTVHPKTIPRVKMTLFEYGDTVIKRVANNNNDNQQSEGGLSSGQVTGIVIGVIAFIAVCAVVGLIICKKHNQKDDSAEVFSNINV